MKYIALIRGINVGGRVVLMKDLVAMFETMNFKNISTYIQSGNVFFETDETNEKALETKIANVMEKQLGYAVSVMIRTGKEMADIAEHNPYKNIETGDLVKQNVIFLSEKPTDELLKDFLALSNEKEKLSFRNREIYHLEYRETKERPPKSILDGLERKLKVAATVRNTNTVKKIAAKQQ